MARIAFSIAVWLLICVRLSLADSISIASFNIRIFSDNSRTNAELEQIADRLQQFDLIAVQEANDNEVVERTLAILNGRDLPFAAIVSGDVGRNSADERYVFFWRTDRVIPLSDLGFFPDSQDVFIREPYAVSFRAGTFDFTLVTIHAIYGDTVGDRRAEAGHLGEVVSWVLGADPVERDVLLLGDFNLPSGDRGFDGLRSFLSPVFATDSQTTIADNDLDNIWLDLKACTEWTGTFGIDRFDETVFGGDDKAASLAVSDHRPIWASFSTDGLDDDGLAAPTPVAYESWAAVKAGQGSPKGIDFIVPTK